jgi:hypothetical protein
MKIAALIIILSGLLFAANAYCWNCPPKRCSFDVECGVGCFCYKGEYQIYGRCVTQ